MYVLFIIIDYFHNLGFGLPSHFRSSRSNLRYHQIQWYFLARFLWCTPKRIFFSIIQHSLCKAWVILRDNALFICCFPWGRLRLPRDEKWRFFCNRRSEDSESRFHKNKQVPLGSPMLAILTFPWILPIGLQFLMSNKVLLLVIWLS